ncbi:MAG: hypothetical protein EOP06_00045 [Proteobacteria bacterium]|nr:MAG: hypothetical protein EOP06_00045 [Pseudomonadota bacterium]
MRFTNSFSPKSQAEIDALVKTTAKANSISLTTLTASGTEGAKANSFMAFQIWKATGLDQRSGFEKCFDENAKPADCNPAYALAIQRSD